ncbi:MAG: tetratricopeptide repeat protein [Defluviicoccus sp.]|nr:MAG: tetratricopeptide repeat protein [Defluviicoccus sp.]
MVVAGWAVFTHFDAKSSDATSSVTVTASGGSVAVGGDVTAPVTVNTPPEQLAPLIKAATDPLTALTAQQQATIGDLQRQLGVGEGAVRAFFRILGEEAVPRERWTEKLAEIAERFKRLQQDLAATSGDTPEITRLKQDARIALEAGDLQRADDLLQQVLAEEDRANEQRRLQAAVTSAQRGAIAMTRLRYRDAAGHFAGAAARVPPDHAAERLRHLDDEAKALYQQGNEFGDNEALQEAIERYRVLLSLRPRDDAPLDWAVTQNCLGIALRTLGEREGGTARLKDAVAAFRAALQEYTRARRALDWAMTQNNLGNALQTLGARESGTARLQDAVAAYRAALQEYTRERVPLDWAMTQNNLGTALVPLGERESGTARLEDAVRAYRAALQERTRERVPLNWATTQNNLGNALATLGERESGTARLEEAVAAYRAALQERTRERVPLDWAATQNNLGTALQSLGERESGTARLEEAIAAYRAALQEYARERVPPVGHNPEQPWRGAVDGRVTDGRSGDTATRPRGRERRLRCCHAGRSGTPPRLLRGTPAGDRPGHRHAVGTPGAAGRPVNGPGAAPGPRAGRRVDEYRCIILFQWPSDHRLRGHPAKHYFE